MRNKSKPKFSDWLIRLVIDRVYQYEIIISECTIAQTTMIWLCGNITSIPNTGEHTPHPPRSLQLLQHSSWLQLSPSCQSLDNSGHIIGLYWQNVIIFHQPRRGCRGCESLQCWLLCCVLLMMMIFKLSDISAQVSRVWAPSPVSQVTRPENWQLGLQLTAGQRSGSTSQTW